MSICGVKEAPPAPDRCLSGSGAPPPAPRDPCAGYTQDGTPRWNRKPPLGWESGFAADTGCRGLRRRVASWWSGAASAPGHPLRGLATGSGTRPNRPDSSPACGVWPRGTQGPHETAEAQRGKCHARDAQPGGEGEPWCGTGACPPFLSRRCGTAGGGAVRRARRADRGGRCPGSPSFLRASALTVHTLWPSSRGRPGSFSQWG